MKIKILKPCMTPEGSHQPGDTVETDMRCAEYLITNGYGQDVAAKTLRVETATAPAAPENASTRTRKPQK